ncbi:MAG TPA: PqiC family protein [Candidatus Polarisedimenticolia bacterium]|nr:PqiC family protein [Candidatus Polarisedimenticolia bacterium]
MNTSPFHRVAVACVLGLFLGGCSLLKPSGITPRTFVLTAAASAAETSPGSTNIVIGIRTVKVPGYLSGKGFAMRQGSNEIVYLEDAEWAERMDNALQRVLAANLCSFIPTDQVRLSLWGAESVSAQVEVNVAQFDVDANGEAVLKAWWRVMSNKGELIDSGRFSASRKGPSPKVDANGAAASMSALVADLSHTLAQVIQRQEK